MVLKVIAFLSIAVAGAQAATLDLSPVPHTTQIEGGVIQDTAFRNGLDLVLFQPPAQWQASGEASRVTFRAPTAGAEITITAHPKPRTNTFDEETLKALKAELMSRLPRDATKLEWGEDQPGMVLLNRHDTYRVELAYTSANQRFKATTVFCNFAAQQLRFQLTCREGDFNDLLGLFKSSVASFQGLE